MSVRRYKPGFVLVGHVIQARTHIMRVLCCELTDAFVMTNLTVNPCTNNRDNGTVVALLVVTRSGVAAGTTRRSRR